MQSPVLGTAVEDPAMDYHHRKIPTLLALHDHGLSEDHKRVLENILAILGEDDLIAVLKYHAEISDLFIVSRLVKT